MKIFWPYFSEVLCFIRYWKLLATFTVFLMDQTCEIKDNNAYKDYRTLCTQYVYCSVAVFIALDLRKTCKFLSFFFSRVHIISGAVDKRIICISQLRKLPISQQLYLQYLLHRIKIKYWNLYLQILKKNILFYVLKSF